MWSSRLPPLRCSASTTSKCEDEMPRLWQVTKLIRSKNSGPFELTFDVIFKDRETYVKVRDARIINAQWFAKTYQLKPDAVSVINYDVASAIKITIPRPAI